MCTLLLYALELDAYLLFVFLIGNEQSQLSFQAQIIVMVQLLSLLASREVCCSKMFFGLNHRLCTFRPKTIRPTNGQPKKKIRVLVLSPVWSRRSIQRHERLHFVTIQKVSPCPARLLKWYIGCHPTAKCVTACYRIMVTTLYCIFAKQNKVPFCISQVNMESLL